MLIDEPIKLIQLQLLSNQLSVCEVLEGKIMKWKIEQGWNCELISETGLRIPRFNVIQAQDSRDGKWIFLLSTTTAYTSHGGDGTLKEINVIDCETDTVINAHRFADFVIEIPPHYAFLVE